MKAESVPASSSIWLKSLAVGKWFRGLPLLSAFVLIQSEAETQGKRSMLFGVMAAMHDDRTYENPSEVSAENGRVKLDGPDSVEVAMTPEAAEETAERMIDQAVMARGQRIMKAIKITKNKH